MTAPQLPLNRERANPKRRNCVSSSGMERMARISTRLASALRYTPRWVIRWLQGTEKIRKNRNRSKRVKFSKKPHYPEMKGSLYREYNEVRYVQVVLF